jgi:hypothetical protein
MSSQQSIESEVAEKLQEFLSASGKTKPETTHEAISEFHRIYSDDVIGDDAQLAAEVALKKAGVSREVFIAVLAGVSDVTDSSRQVKFETLKAEHDPELVDHAVGQLEEYHEHGSKRDVTLTSDSTITVLEHHQIDGFIDATVLYATLATKTCHFESIGDDTTVDEIASVVDNAVRYSVEAYARDIAVQVKAGTADRDDIIEYVARYIDHFPVWHAVNYDAVNEELLDLHHTISAFQRFDHLSESMIQDKLAELGY